MGQLLAEAGPTAAGIGNAVLIIALFVAVAANVAMVVAVFKRQSISPQPLEIKAVSEYMTVHECNARHAAIKEEFGHGDRSRKGIYMELEKLHAELAKETAEVRREMGEMERRLNSTDEARTVEVHKQLNQILGAVAELRGEVNAEKKGK